MQKRYLLILFIAVITASNLLACGGSSLPVSQPIPSPSPTTLLVPMGVDYGLKRQCIRSPYPSGPNFYVDNVDCPGGAYPTSNDWITVAEIENPFVAGGPCIGSVNGQAVLINGPGSPVTQHWLGNHNTGYSMEMKVDYTSIANPCSPPTWTATGLIDNDAFSNAPFPRPDQAMLEFDATFNAAFRGSGATHASAEFGSSWLAAGYNLPIQVSTEVELWDNPMRSAVARPPARRLTSFVPDSIHRQTMV